MLMSPSSPAALTPLILLCPTGGVKTVISSKPEGEDIINCIFKKKKVEGVL